MGLLILTIALLVLLALNAFFVLAEFAIVKVRPSRVAELAASGESRAEPLADIQQHLDEYLSVCQVGITLASVALGMIGKKATDVIMGDAEDTLLRYGLAIAASYVVVSGSHIVLGELVPKSVAIRLADRAALAASRPLRWFRVLFFPALWLLTLVSNGILRLLGLQPPTGEDEHSEEELRIILDHSQERGMMSFRRLLYLENVFDLGGLVARDAMRPRSLCRCLEASRSWSENLSIVKQSRFTRYPLITGDPDHPAGFIHVKDVLLHDGPPDLEALARSILTTVDTTPLETLLAEMQRRRIHAALVLDSQSRWIGFITFEDVIEELVGTIRDEFEDEDPLRLVDALAPGNIHLSIEAESQIAAVRTALDQMSPASLPLPAPDILQAVEDRERLVGTYLGHGIGMPHARIAGLGKPFLMILRSRQGVPYGGTGDRAHLLFVLLTPAGQPRVHQRLQSIIVMLLHESEFVRERLLTATSPEEVLEVLRAGEQTALG